MASKVLEIKNLEKRYNKKFNLHIDYLFSEENKILALIGPNGSGKSTLIKIINLLEKPDCGSIYFDDANILGSNIDKAEIRKKMAVVFQEPLLFNTSAYNNILLGIKVRKIKLSHVKDKFDYLVQKLKIASLLQRSIKYLSGGEKQRVSLARALVLDPKLLLLDEPLANIDQQSRESLRLDLFEVLKSFGKSVIYVTHDRNEAMILADNIAVINNGRIEQFGSKDEVLKRPANEFIAKFVGVETLVNGVVIESKNNVCEVKVKNSRADLKIFVAGEAEKNLEVALAIRPEDVILYNIKVSPDKSSAMNLFNGKITGIRNVGIFKKIEIDCGFDLISFVTQNSIDRLGLEIGKNIEATVKASSVHLFKR
jgi:tungstate transport system ATP-binding protein